MVDPSEVERVTEWATRLWGPDANLTRLNIAFASWKCPDCRGPLTETDSPRFRACRPCRLHWYAQRYNDDGTAREGSYIDAFRVID